MPPKGAGAGVDPAAAAAQLMQNPEFMALFQKAMGGDGGAPGPIPGEGDPKREAWLRDMQTKLERAAQEEAKQKLETPVTDEDGQWMYVVPEPGFCIKCKTRDAASKDKVFINICKHARVAEPMPMDPSECDDDMQADAVRYRIPLSCGAPRPDVDKSGAPCRVYDVIVNPLTVQRCNDDAEFRRFVAALCMSWIQQKHEKALNNEEFTNVNFKCKGTPEVQRIRLAKPGAGPGAATNAMNNDIQLPKNPSVGTAPIAPRSAQGRSGKMVVEVEMPSAAGGDSNKAGGATSSASKSAAAAAAPPAPAFVLAKIGAYDWAPHAKPTKNPYFHETVPRELAVEVSLDGAQSIKEVDVRIAPKQLELRWIDEVADKGDDGCAPFLVVPLGFPVLDEPASAKFSKKSRTLTLRLTVALPDEVEMEQRRARESREEQEREDAASAATKGASESELAQRRAKYDRIQQEERDVMAQRREFVENMKAVNEGAVPPSLKTEIAAMPPDQARLMLMRLESRTRNGDGIDDMLDKMPDDVLFSVCNCIRDRLGLEHVKAPAPPPAAAPSAAGPGEGKMAMSDNGDGGADAGVDREYNFAKKSENLFGVKMYNRFTQWSAYAFLRRPIRSEKPPRRSGAAIHADRFTDKVLPEFRERQVALALEGRGMFAARGGLQNERELRAAAHQSRGGGRGGGGDGRGGTGRTRAELNPSLSINRPEVKRALSAAAAQRRHQSHRTLSGATPGNLLRR